MRSQLLLALCESLLLIVIGASFDQADRKLEPEKPVVQMSDLARRVAKACKPRKVFDWQVDPLDSTQIVVWCYDPRRPSYIDSRAVPR